MLMNRKTGVTELRTETTLRKTQMAIFKAMPKQIHLPVGSREIGKTSMVMKVIVVDTLHSHPTE
jgi:hypothetical protein